MSLGPLGIMTPHQHIGLSLCPPPALVLGVAVVVLPISTGPELAMHVGYANPKGPPITGPWPVHAGTGVVMQGGPFKSRNDASAYACGDPDGQRRSGRLYSRPGAWCPAGDRVPAQLGSPIVIGSALCREREFGYV